MTSLLKKLSELPSAFGRRPRRAEAPRLSTEERERIHNDVALDPSVDEALEGALAAYPQFDRKAPDEGGLPSPRSSECKRGD